MTNFSLRMKRKSLIIHLTFILVFSGLQYVNAQTKSVKPKPTNPEPAKTSSEMAFNRAGTRTDVLLEEYEKIIKENPNDVDAWFGKANCEFLLKRPKLSVYSLHQTIRLQPTHAGAYALMGKIMKLTNKNDSAAICYELAAQYEKDVDKKVEYKSFMIMKLIKEKKMQEAYNKIKEIYVLAPTNHNVAFYYAKMSNFFNQYEEAQKSIRKIEPDLQKKDLRESAKYYYELGYALYQLQRFDEAKPILQKIQFGPFKRKVDKLSAPYFYNLANTYAKFHEENMSMMYLDQALRIDKDYTKAHLLKAELSKRNQDVSATIEHMRMAAKNQPDPVKKLVWYDKIAETQMEAGDYDGSLNTLNEAMKLKAGKIRASRPDPDTWFLMCLAQYKIGNHKEAIADIDDFLSKKIPVPTSVLGNFYFLKGLAAKGANDLKLAREAFKLAFKTPASVRDAAEVELIALSELKSLENETDDDAE